MEELRARDLASASHPYTRGLLDSLPRIDRPREELPTLSRDPSWLAAP
jgi:peptide/nickel transport system ATP-binding protein